MSTSTVLCDYITAFAHARKRTLDDHGEGVISAAIAVLIMAFLGVAMWIGFSQIWADAEATTGSQVRQIGR